MKLTENRPLAFGVLIAVILFSIIGQGSLGMLNERGNIEEKFMLGEPYRQALRCAESAQQLSHAAGIYLTEGMAEKYGDAAAVSALKNGGYAASAETLSALAAQLGDRKQTPDPNAVIECLTALRDAAEMTYSGALLLQLPENDQRDIKLAYHDITGALDIIARDGDSKDSYVKPAQRFNRRIKGFPAAIFADLLNVTPLSIYAG